MKFFFFFKWSAHGAHGCSKSPNWNVENSIYSWGTSGLEEAVHVAHLHNHSLQLGVVLNGHLSIFSAKAWWNTEETNVYEAHQSEWIVSESEAE